MIAAPSAHIPPARAGAFPVRAGNRIAPLVDGGPAFSRIVEVIDLASESVWVTVAFIEVDAQFPGGRGTLFDVLDAAASRGLDVRALVWDPDEAFRANLEGGHLPATAASHDLLSDRATTWQLRWDRVDQQCQHQKSWVVDGGTREEIAFVGGINLNQGSMAWPTHEPPDVHDREGNIHDLYVEAAGPVARDVTHNFVQRWNGASEQDKALGTWPSGQTTDLAVPTDTPVEQGSVSAQVTRSIMPGLYDLDDGENGVREQYLVAIESARTWIHIENQILLSRAVLAALDDALERGVAVTALVPAEPMPVLAQAAAHPGIAAAFDALTALGRHEHFTLAAPAVMTSPGTYSEIYVHAKAALIDDGWATIGSTNLVFTSFQGDTEMNLSWWDPATITVLRVDLLREHLAEDTSLLDPGDAAERFAVVARQNRTRRAEGEALVGHAVQIEPSTWAR